MINKKRALGLILAVAPLTVLADGNVTGTVFSNETNTPIDYANVQLVDALTQKPTAYAGHTDDNGNFNITGVKDGKYILIISNIGSVSQERPVVVANGTVSVGRVTLAEDSKMLEEVVVTGIKGQMRFELDKKVFNVDSNISAAGISASELLEEIPSVEVDQDGGISLRGNESVTVWINGKESGMTADNRAQILEQIPAETIERVEVITNPSAKYSPEGTAGIINIVLKKDQRGGYFGSAELGANTRGGGNANFNINYNYGKWETFAGVGLRMRHSKGGSESYRTYDDGTYLNSLGERRNHGVNGFLRLGATYHLTDQDDFYVSAFGMLGHRWGRNETSYLSNVPGQWMSNFNNTHNRGDSRGGHIEWGYKHSWNSNHTLDMNVGFNRWGGPSWENYLQNQVWEDSEAAVYQEQDQSVNVNNWEAKIDYTNQVLPWLKLEAGYNGNYNHENTPVMFQTGTTKADMSLDRSLCNQFVYNNNITALYFTLGGKYRALSFSAGLRGEAWQVRTTSYSYDTDWVSSDGTYKKNNFALFPSAFVSWSLPYDNELQVNYTRRIRRPWGPQLNSFKNTSDPTVIHTGNPELAPEYTNSFELNYIKSWQNHMVSLSAYMRTSDDMISHVSFMADAPGGGEQTMYMTHANVGEQTNSGAEIVVKNNFFNRVFDLTTTFNLYNNHVSAWSIAYPLDGKSYTVSRAKQNQFAWDVRCMAAFRLPWDLSIQLTGRYNSRTLTAQGAREPGWDVQAGVRKNAGPWSFSVNCRDIFDSRKRHSITYGDNYIQDSESWRGGRTVQFTIKYSFGNMKDSRKRSQIQEQSEPMDGSGYGGN